MPALNFVGQSAQDKDNLASNTSRLVNCYRESNGESLSVKSVLGMVQFSTLTGAVVRAMARVGGIIYVVHGGNLWSVSDSGVAVNLGAIPDSDMTTISGNNGKVTIVANGNYYVLSSGTITQPTAGAFSSFGSVTFLGQLTVLTEKNGRRIQWSAVANPLTLNGLSFATTESRDDNNIRATTIGGELWIFKEQSIERWAQASTGVFGLPGATIDKGLKAFGLLSSAGLGGFFVANDNRAYVVGAGGAMQPVSTAAVETSIKQDSPQTVLYHQDEGHEFYCITFPARPAWCYDTTSGEWCERGEGVSGAWSADYSAEAYGASFVAGPDGTISRLDRVNVDYSGPLVRTMVSRNMNMEGNYFTVPKLEFQARTGYSEAPQVMLRISRDRGNLWSVPMQKSLGSVGSYDETVAFRALGRGKNFAAELSIADAFEVTIDATAWVGVA